MANQWLRLWHELPNDPKWRTIAKASGRPISEVISTFIHVLVTASQNVTRGHADVTAEDIASALDIETTHVEAILEAMQGRVMDGTWVKGWDVRQAKKEENTNPESRAKSAAERKREQRERERQEAESRGVTRCHDESREVTPDKRREEEIREEGNSSVAPRRSSDAKGSRLADDWAPSPLLQAWALDTQQSWNPDHLKTVIEKFRDYWLAQPGAKGRKTDWDATFRNWVRNEKPLLTQVRSSGNPVTDHNKAAYAEAMRRAAARNGGQDA